MPISFKSKLSSAVTNQTFLDKTIDDATVGKFSLREDSSTHVEDVQLFLNTLRTDIDNNDTELADHEIRITDNENTLVDHETRIGDNETQLSDHETRIGTNETEIQAIEDSVGAASGICPLDANSKVPLVNIPDSLIGALTYQGTWDADTNTPALTSSTGTKGHYYVVSVAGSTDLDGITDWNQGDFAVYNGVVWERIDNTDAVISVNSKTGVVVLDKTDIGLTNVTDDAQLKRTAADFDSFTEKVVAVEDDIVLIEDSEDSYNKKKVKLANMLGSGGGGGGSFIWELNGTISPLEVTLQGISSLYFASDLESEIWAYIQVPETYDTAPIKLKGISFTTQDSADNVLFRCQTFLNRAGESINYENHTSTNTELTLTVSDIVNVIDEIDLTDANGQINSVQVLPNDYLAIRLYRDITNETVSASDNAKFFKYSASIAFTD